MAPRPFIPVYDAIESELTFRLGSLFLCNRVWHYWPEFLWPPSPELSVAGALGTWVINQYLPLLADDLELVSVRSRQRHNASDAWVTIPFTGYTGSYGSEAMSANVTLLWKDLHLRRAGQRFGGLYVPAPPRSAIIENTATQEYADAFNDLVDGIQELDGLLGTEWCSVSFQVNGAYRSEGVPRLRGIMRLGRQVRPARYRMNNTTVYPP